MQYTLLELTQNILSGMSSDEVNSISDSTESLQVATILRNKYFDIITRVNLPEHQQLIQLEPSLNVAEPVMMFVPNNVAEIVWLKYFNTNPQDTASTTDTHDVNTDIPADETTSTGVIPGYQYVTILPIEQFIEYTNSFNPSDTDVESFVFNSNVNGIPGTYTFYYKNDNQPSFCTILSNYYVIFDSYDSTQDSTLQASKTMAWGRVIPVFEMVDSFIPNLDDEQFQLLLNEAKALAYFELKQMSHPFAQQEIKRGWSTVQKNKSKSNKPSYFNALPDFGRSARPFNQPESYFKYRGFDNY